MARGEKLVHWDWSKLLGVRYRQRVASVEVPLPRWPAALDRFSICQLTDLHRGAWISEAYIRRAVKLALDFAPQLVVLTGDYVSNARYAESCAAALRELKAPLGIYAVLGNHDYWSKDAPRVQRALERAGVVFLTNRAVEIDHQGARFWLAGVDDVLAGQPDLEQALNGIPAGEPVILLCHEPDFAPYAAERQVSLQISGHSHAGQVSIPGMKPVLPRLGRLYPVGLMKVEESETLVYVSGGIGVIFPPIRFRCPPEISHLQLRKARPEEAAPAD
jgi:predicted MPP superfamily phosphohydrolase